LLGLTLAIEYNTGRVWECGRDGRPRWELTGLQGPMEAQVLPGGRVLVAEARNHTVSERDTHGKTWWKYDVQGDPTGCQRLPGGNTFVSTHGSVLELGPDGKEVFRFNLPTGSNAIRKGRNGRVLYASDTEVVELDLTGRRVRGTPLPNGGMYVGIEDLPGGHYLLANSATGTALEVDGAGKVVWSARVSGACGVSRLPNGHTLVGTSGRVVEVDRAGKAVWETATRGYVRRVHRR
jgi:YD repeat-containing protein